MTNPDDAPDHCEVPWALVAFALQVYVDPGVRLTISTEVSVDVPVRVMPPVLDEHDTVYERIADPPSDTGGVTDTVTEVPLGAPAATASGGSGAVMGATETKFHPSVTDPVAPLAPSIAMR
jgi:hypothetical protein